MMRKSTLLVALAAALLFVGTSCDTIVTLAKPNVAYEAINSGASLRLTWTAITDAASYEITTDDSVFTTTSTSFDVLSPTGTITVKAVKGSDKSDPATIDCKVVETPSLVLFGISDANATDASGLAFTTSGSASALSLVDANKPTVDFVCDDVQASVTPVGLINAGDYSWASNTKVNTLAAAGTDYDTLSAAPAAGNYDTQLATAANGVYALWLSSSQAWTTSDHFCKVKIITLEQPIGTYYKVTLKAAYQKIGGLRWLVN